MRRAESKKPHPLQVEGVQALDFEHLPDRDTVDCVRPVVRDLDRDRDLIRLAGGRPAGDDEIRVRSGARYDLHLIIARVGIQCLRLDHGEVVQVRGLERGLDVDHETKRRGHVCRKVRNPRLDVNAASGADTRWRARGVVWELVHHRGRPAGLRKRAEGRDSRNLVREYHVACIDVAQVANGECIRESGSRSQARWISAAAHLEVGGRRDDAGDRRRIVCDIPIRGRRGQHRRQGEGRSRFQ